MASGLTPIYSLPYPLSTDGVDVHGDLEDLSLKVEEILSIKPNINLSNTFTGVNNFLVNSSNPAVKITQLGSGPALLVEDGAGPDTTPFIITSGGLVGINTSTPTSALTVDSGGVLFNTTTLIDGDVTVGINTGTSRFFTVFGSLIARDTIQAANLYATNSIAYRDAGGGGDINILVPIGGLTASRDIRLPDVDGTFITTGNVNDLYPVQTSNSGKVLTTNGSVVSWTPAPNQVPAIAGQQDKWLTTNGTTYYWENLLLIPPLDDTPDFGTTGKWLTNDGDDLYWDFLPGQEPFIEVTSDIVLTVGANLFCDTRNGFFTITLPVNPLPGASVTVFDTQDFFQSEYVIIDPGTEKINTIEGDLIINVGGATVVLIYINETIGWRLA